MGLVIIPQTRIFVRGHLHALLERGWWYCAEMGLGFSSVDLTWAGSSEVAQASYKGRCSCKKPPQVRVCVTATRDKNEATLEVIKKVPMCPAANLAVALLIP